MWQIAVVMLILAAAAIYLVRRYTRIYRAEVPSCSACSGDCALRARGEAVPCACESISTSETLGGGSGRS